eukprot:s1694_g5.t2
MTNLLVSDLYEASEDASAAQSFSQGGFAAGCVAMLLLEQAFRQSYGTQMMFFAAGGLTSGAGLIFCALPRLDEKPLAIPASTGASKELRFTMACNVLAVMAVGVEVTCGTWLITTMSQNGFAPSTATQTNMIFWMLFAVSRLALAPYICRVWKPNPSTVVSVGSAISAVCCIPAVLFPDWLPAVVLAVGGVALGAGPSYAMTISMVKDRQGLTSMDSALFSVAASLGAGFMPFLMSRVLLVFGPDSYFFSLFVIAATLAGFSYVLNHLAPAPSHQCTDEEQAELYLSNAEDTPEKEIYTPMELHTLQTLSERKESSPKEMYTAVELHTMPTLSERKDSKDAECSVPPIVWMYWEQGWDDAPLISRICASSWEQANPNMEVRKICKDDLQELIPEEIDTWPRLWEIHVAQRTDFVRLALLKRFGGIWADSTLFCAGPVMPWLESLCSVQDQAFFVFDRSDSSHWSYDPFLSEGLQLSSFFIASSRGHALTSAWLEHLRREMEGDTIHYFSCHFAFHRMLDEDTSKRQLFHKVPKVSAQHPHTVEFELGFAAPATSNVLDALKRSLTMAPVMKLSSKILQDEFLLKLLRAEPSALSALLDFSAALDILLLIKQAKNAKADVSELVDLVKQEREITQRVREGWQLSYKTTLPTGK